MTTCGGGFLMGCLEGVSVVFGLRLERSLGILSWLLNRAREICIHIVWLLYIDRFQYYIEHTNTLVPTHAAETLS